MSELYGATAYTLVRPLAPIQEPFRATDQTFAAARLDDRQIEDANFEHCAIANISFKKATLRSGRFLNCTFVGCYFRRAELVDCAFVGCRFIDCNLKHIALKGCSFKHSSFYGCQIAYSELEHCLPSEPNLREELTRNLSIESGRLGLKDEARAYRLASIGARESHLKATFLGESQWYKDHFDGLERFWALFRYSRSLANRWLWGYGERAFVLARNLIVTVFLFFPVLFFLWRDGLTSESGGEITLWDAMKFSAQNVLPAGFMSGIAATSLLTNILAGFESLIGVVSLALFASYLFRWSLNR